MAMPPSIDPQDLLQQAPWLRRLARALVGDGADDLIQDACVVLLERPHAISDPVGWFAGTLRNLARRAGRSRARQRARERQFAPGETVIATDALLERADWQNALVHAVHAMREPYRSALLLRYVEELAPRAIARTLNVSVHTVHTRIARGLELLREQLDRTGGGRGSWMPSLAAWTNKPSGFPTPLKEAILMNTAAKIGAATLAAVLGLGAWSAWKTPAPELPQALTPPATAKLEGTNAESQLRVDLPLETGAQGTSRVADAHQQPQLPAPKTLSTQIELHITSAFSGTPIAGVLVGIVPDNSASEVASKQAGARQLSNEQGLALIEVPSGHDLRLFARGPAGQVGQATLAVEALNAGERRTLSVSLPEGLDRTWRGQVVDDKSGAPIEMAQVELQDHWSWQAGAQLGEKPIANTTTRSDGSFELPVASWRPTVAWVRSKGYASRLIGIALHNDVAGEQQIIPLERAARLEVLVQMAGLEQQPPFQVLVSTESFKLLAGQELALPQAWPEARWSITWDGLSTPVFEDLPVGVPLQLELRKGPRLLVSMEDKVQLQAGETRQVSFEVNPLGSIAGRVVEADGRPVARQGLWLMRAGAQGPYLFTSFDRERKQASVKSDTEGRFRFSGVGDGDWWVGPQASQFPYGNPKGVAQDAVAPLATLVHVQNGSAQTMEIVLQRGLMIAGRVQDASGAAVPHAWVNTVSPDLNGGPLARSGLDGSFVVGPLPAASYQVRAIRDGVSSERVTAQPGMDDLLLVFPPAGGIEGRLLGLKPEHIGRFLLFSPAGSGARGAASVPRDRLRFLQYTAEEAYAIPRLQPGTYDVAAWSAGHWAAVRRGVVVREGVTTKDIDLRLSPAARIAVRYSASEPYARFEAIQGDSLVAAVYVGKDSTEILVVPPGATTVRLWSMGGKALGARDVSPIAGEQVDVHVEEDEIGASKAETPER